MTELVLKSRVSRQKLDSIIYFLKMLNIDAEIKKNHRLNNIKKDPFDDTFGMWKDRDIDGQTLRKKAWGIQN